MSSQETPAATMLEDVQRREDQAWAMIIARETGKKYRTEHQIKTETKVTARRIADMVDRCRAMRKALGTSTELPGEWWTARMMPLTTPDITTTEPATI